MSTKDTAVLYLGSDLLDRYKSKQIILSKKDNKITIIKPSKQILFVNRLKNIFKKKRLRIIKFSYKNPKEEPLPF